MVNPVLGPRPDPGSPRRPGRAAGRLGSGLQLVCALVPAQTLFKFSAAPGALLALGLMGGASASHLLRLGIEVQGDGGLLFGLACLVTVAAACVAWLRRAELPLVGPRLAST